MSLVKLVVILEVSQDGGVSIRSFDIERVSSSPKGVTAIKVQPISSGEDVVPMFLSKLSNNQNEIGILRMLIEGRRSGTPVYRRQILNTLGFDQLLQWNGVAAWLTRHWRVVTGNPNADITANRYDQSQEDYEITFAPGISDEVIERFAESSGVGR
ncbi:MAG TPA: hypothetical protein VMV76_07700 [Dehalococcoidia bacterium]|nr:hypothetical protein [Dehalococcoidia bacterium]